MERALNKSLLEDWIEKNGPFGIEKLAVKARVSVSTIMKARAGKTPRRQSTRVFLAEAIGISEDSLFPMKKKRAS